MFGELNKGTRTIKEGVDLNKLEFKPLSDFAGKVLTVEGFFFTSGKYGKQVAVVANGCKVNLPKRAVEQFETIYASGEMIEAMFAGKLIIKDIVNDVETKNGKTTSYVLADN